MSDLFFVSMFGALAACLAFLAGDRVGYYFGVLGGYGAARWPDSPYFHKARKILNAHRAQHGIRSLEAEGSNEAKGTA